MAIKEAFEQRKPISYQEGQGSKQYDWITRLDKGLRQCYYSSCPKAGQHLRDGGC